jgi:hypothetical protein
MIAAACHSTTKESAACMPARRNDKLTRYATNTDGAVRAAFGTVATHDGLAWKLSRPCNYDTSVVYLSCMIKVGARFGS